MRHRHAVEIRNDHVDFAVHELAAGRADLGIGLCRPVGLNRGNGFFHHRHRRVLGRRPGGKRKRGARKKRGRNRSQSSEFAYVSPL